MSKVYNEFEDTPGPPEVVIVGGCNKLALGVYALIGLGAVLVICLFAAGWLWAAWFLTR